MEYPAALKNTMLASYPHTTELTFWKRPWCWEIMKAGGKGTTEDEMAGWHHQLDGHEFGWTPEVGDGQGVLACLPGGRKELDTTKRLNWTELNISCTIKLRLYPALQPWVKMNFPGRYFFSGGFSQPSTPQDFPGNHLRKNDSRKMSFDLS